MGAILAIGNLADTATLTTTSGTMLRPLTELQVPWARGLARGPVNYVSSTTLLVVRADLGAAKNFSAIGIVGLNNAVAMVSDMRFSNTAFGNTDRGTGTMENDGLSGTTHGNSLWYVSAKSARYIEAQVEVFNLPDGLRHVDARRLLIMSADGTDSTTVTLSDGVDFNWSLTNVDMTESTVTSRGGVFVSEQGTYRALQFSVSGMTVAEATSLRAWLAAARKKTECVVSLRNESTDILQSNRTVYGRLVDWSPIVHTGGDTYACESITVHETPYPAL